VKPRFTIPLLPYLALLATLGVKSVLEALVPRGLGQRARRTVLAAASLALLAVPTYACGRLVWLRTLPDTHTLAARWIAERVERDTQSVWTQFLAYLPLLQEVEPLSAFPTWALSPWERYQLTLPPEAREGRAFDLVPLFRRGMYMDGRLSKDEIESVMAETDADYAVVTVAVATARDELDATRDVVRARAGLPVHAIVPFDLPQEGWTSSGYEHGTRAFAKVLNARLWGPPFEIYRMPR
jgi:hypothetical protein